MRKWLPTSLCIVVGLCFGFALGFVISLNKIIFNNPATASASQRNDGFTRAFESLVRLSSDESVFTTGSTGSKESNLALNNEKEMLKRLGDTEPASFSPPVKVAQARLFVRRSMIVPGPEPQMDARLQSLLEESGWTNPSADHMRDIIKAIDKNRKDICTCDSRTKNASQHK
jgi:hypothetical protein